MRGFNCYIYYYREEDEKKVNLTAVNNTACWAGLQILTPFYSYNGKIKVLDNEIYLKNFDEKETQEFQKRIIWLINKITPCSIVEINSNKYIKYKMLGGYNQNLVLLNFIRNLWCEPGGSSSGTFKGFHKYFFEALKDSRYKEKIKDPLERLTWANKQACSKFTFTYSPGHSNAHPASKLKLKKTEELLKYTKEDVASTVSFLTN